MAELLLTLLGVALVFSIVVVLGGWLAINKVGAALDRHHQERQWILSTGLAPESWYGRCERLLEFLERIHVGSRLLRILERACKRQLERRLARLIRYIAESNVINDEKIRRSLSGTLRRIGRSWEDSSWEEVTGTSVREDTDSRRL